MLTRNEFNTLNRIHTLIKNNAKLISRTEEYYGQLLNVPHVQKIIVTYRRVPRTANYTSRTYVYPAQ